MSGCLLLIHVQYVHLQINRYYRTPDGSWILLLTRKLTSKWQSLKLLITWGSGKSMNGFHLQDRQRVSFSSQMIFIWVQQLYSYFFNYLDFQSIHWQTCRVGEGVSGAQGCALAINVWPPSPYKSDQSINLLWTCFVLSLVRARTRVKQEVRLPRVETIK